MKTKSNLSKLLAISLILLVFACSKNDDSGGGNSGINVQNLVTTTDENLSNGEIVGTVQAVGDGALSFSITSQIPNGALSINPSSGELTVANASLFDFETNPVISATVSIIDATNTATAMATINLNDLDDIESFLSTSQTDYVAAADGDWVEVTAVEYNALASSLNEVTKVSTSDADYNQGSTTTTGASFTLANNNGVTMPNGSYVFAFKYDYQTADVTTIKVKQSSTSVDMGYQDLGGTLSSSNLGDSYFVLKGNNSPTSNIGFLAIYDLGGSLGFSSNITDNDIFYETSDANTLSTPQGASTIMYQGLSTTQKQW